MKKALFLAAICLLSTKSYSFLLQNSPKKELSAEIRLDVLGSRFSKEQSYSTAVEADYLALKWFMVFKKFSSKGLLDAVRLSESELFLFYHFNDLLKFSIYYQGSSASLFWNNEPVISRLNIFEFQKMDISTPRFKQKFPGPAFSINKDAFDLTVAGKQAGLCLEKCWQKWDYQFPANLKSPSGYQYRLLQVDASYKNLYYSLGGQATVDSRSLVHSSLLFASYNLFGIDLYGAVKKEDIHSINIGQKFNRIRIDSTYFSGFFNAGFWALLFEKQVTKLDFFALKSSTQRTVLDTFSFFYRVHRPFLEPYLGYGRKHSDQENGYWDYFKIGVALRW